MEVRGKASIGFVAIAVLAAAQSGDFYLKDKSGKSSITDWTSFRAKVISEDRQLFNIVGNPFTAVWEGQKMTIKARTGELTALSVSTQTSIVEKATMGGGVVAVATRPSRVVGSSVEQTVRIETAQLVYTAENERLAFPSKVSVDQDDKPAGQSFGITGSRGWVDLHPTGSPNRQRQAIQAMHLEGPVAFELHSLADVKDPDNPGKRVKKPVVVKGKGQLLTYDDRTRKLTLVRDVEIDGTHPTLFGKVKALRAELTLDANWNPIEIELVGQPGTTTVTDPPPLRFAVRAGPTKDGRRARLEKSAP